MTVSSQPSESTPAPPGSLWRSRPVSLEGSTTLATFTAGRDDGPALVLVHGLGHWTEAAWDRLLPHFAATHRIIAFDLPGFGASSKPDRAYPLLYFRRALEAVIAAYDVQTISLAGHSLGGLIAADYAATNPTRVEALVLIDPAGFLRTPKMLLRMLASRPLTWLLGTIRPTRGWLRRAFETAVFDPAMLTEAMHQRMFELTRDPKMRRAFARVYRDAIREFFDLPFLHARLGTYQGPALIMWGREDRYIPVRALARAERVYPHAALVIFGRCGHCPNIEVPAQVAASMHALFARD